MIHTYIIIIAATLNTISISILLSYCLTDDETGVSEPGAMLGLTHPGQGWPQRSQLQPACASVSRSDNSSNGTSFNISLFVSASSLNRRVGFIESLRCFQDYGVRWCHDWAFVGFCFAKIAWQLALHTRDGACFREEVCECIRDFSPA